MANAFYDTELSNLNNQRSAALRAGDADAWHVADSKLQAIIAAMHAEVNVGLRADPVFAVQS